MEPEAGKGQRTLFQVGCTKRKRTAEDAEPRELRIRLNPELAARVEREKQVAAAIAARPPPPPPRPVGRPRILPAVQAPPAPKVLWVQLLPTRLPSCQVGVSLRLHFSPQAAAAAAKQAEYDAMQRVWLKVVVHGKQTVGVTLRASPFPLRKQWSDWEKEFGISMAQRFGRGGRSAAARWPMEVSEGTTSSEEEDVEMEGGDE